MNQLSAVVIGLHTQHSASSAIQISHHIAGVCIRHAHRERNNGLKEHGRCLEEALLKCHAGRHLERKLGGIHRVIRTVEQHRLQTDNGVCRERALLAALCNPLLDRREVVLRDCASEDLLLEDISLFQIAGRLKAHLDIAELAVTAGLLLVAPRRFDFLAYGFTERKLRFLKDYLRLITTCELAHDNVKLLIADAVEQGLAVLGVDLGAERAVLFHELRESGRNAVLIAFVLSNISLIGVGLRNLRCVVEYRCLLPRKRIAGLGLVQLCHCTDIARAKFGDLNRLFAAEHINLAALLLDFLPRVEELAVRAEHAGQDLYQAVLADERIRDGLKDLHREVHVRLIVGNKVLTCRQIHAAVPCRSLGRGEVADNGIHQRVCALRIHAGTHHDRRHITGRNLLAKCAVNLLLGKALAREIALHELFAGLRDCLEQSLARNL